MYKQENNVKINSTKIGYENVIWNKLAENKDQSEVFMMIFGFHSDREFLDQLSNYRF
jgi:hypothetical protein